MDLKDHMVLTSAHEIDNITQPLKTLGISYFSYVRSYPDGTHIRLANNPEWTQHYYQKDYYSVVLKQVLPVNNYVLWKCLDKYPLFYDASEHFDVDNGAVTVRQNGDICERYFFGSTKENEQVNNIYLFKPDILDRFILYFKDRAEGLIEQADKSRILLPAAPVVQEAQEFEDDPKLAEFLSQTKIKRYCVNVAGKEVYFPKREAEILALMKEGKTSKESAKVLGIGHRTIERYKDNMKQRLEPLDLIDPMKQAMKDSFISAESLALGIDSQT